jgi:hypothetical protein
MLLLILLLTILYCPVECLIEYYKFIEFLLKSELVHAHVVSPVQLFLFNNNIYLMTRD